MRILRATRWPLSMTWMMAMLSGLARAAAPVADAKALEHFESRVRPLLATHCSICHSEGVKIQSGLKLDSREAMLRGGLRGPAIVPGAPERSLLIDFVRYEGAVKMPPRGKLKEAEIAALTAWVKQGAPWPTAATSPEARAAAKTGVYTFSDEQRKFWSFQPVKRPSLPRVKNEEWCQSPIDPFILSRLESAGLQTAATADRRTLLRRATLDLIGLPPTPEEVEAFALDRSPDAWLKVINRLLDSPRYGERWGRHWLDGVRYADSNGQDENTAHANAFRYRDYVVWAFNSDLPYDQFVREQIAGDLLEESFGLPSDAEATKYRRTTATGFLVLGPKVLAEPDKVKMAIDIIDEQMDVATRAFMGVTFTCARCHDHKFDPFTQRDYYALAGIFRSTKTMATYATVARWFERPLAPQEDADRAAAHQAAIAKKKDELQKIRNQNGKEAQRKQLMQELADLERTQPKAIDYCMAVTEDKVVDLPVHIRGDHNKLGEVVTRRLPAILTPEQPALPAQGSGRLQFAHWLTRPEHPLTARVMVNRLWQGHFGRGLVGTSDNFGKLGDRPSHPELLDWLAARFVAGGWSVKQMHREIMLSATYQQSTINHQPSAIVTDPDNRLLWRQNRQRMSAEQLRDSLLYLSGRLETAMGGSLLTTPNFGYVTNDQSANQGRYDVRRRSVYLPVVRNALYELFQVYDFVDPSVVNTLRAETTVAPQALFMLNNHLVREAAKDFAAQLMAASSREADWPRRAITRVFGRPATDREVAKAAQFLNQFASASPNDRADTVLAQRLALEDYCQMLFCANEFIYID